jgi:CheY-like chemotaxis protein
MSRKLLLADDSITIQKVIGITFANEDYQLTVVDNGDAALQKARLNPPDLVLADVFMPGKNGYELCAAIKMDPALAHVPVLLLSGTFEPFDEQKARDAGADSWISKPFESQALIERVEGLLSRPRPVAPVSPPPSVQPMSAAPVAMQPLAPAVPAAAAAAPPPAWEDATVIRPGLSTVTPQSPAADAWDDDSWQEEAPPSNPLSDPWQEVEEVSAVAPKAEDFSWEETSAAAPVEDDFSWEEPAAAAPEMPSPQLAPPAAAQFTVQEEEEEDLWGSVSFGDEELLGDFGGSSAAEGDLWESAEEEVPAPPVLAAAPTTPVALPQAAPPVMAAPQPAVAPVIAPAPPVTATAPAVIEWEDDQEIPLDDLEILEEEDLFEDDFVPAALAVGGPELGEDLADPFAVREGRGLAVQQVAVEEISFEETAGDSFAMEDSWEADATMLAPSPAARELLATPLDESDWGGELDGDGYEVEEEEFLLSPAQVAMEAAAQMPAVAPAGVPVSAEQLGVYLKEEDIAALVEKVAGSVIERLAESILARIAWEVVPDLAEHLIKDEIRRIKEEVQ